MNLKQLGLPTLEELEAMNDDQLLAHFSKYLTITRPPEGSVAAKPAKIKKAKAVSAPTREELDAISSMAASMGFNIKL